MLFPLNLDFARTGRADPRAVFTRASSALTPLDAGAWREVPAGAPRLLRGTSAAAQGMLLEPSGVNLWPNPRAEGLVSGVLGSGGAVPTGWVANNLMGAFGLVVEIIGPIVIAGAPVGLRTRFHTNGLPTTGAGSFSYEATARNAAPTAAPSGTHTSAAGLRLHAGSLASLSAIQGNVLYLTNAGGVVTSSVSSNLAGGITSTFSRPAFAATASADGTIARVTARYLLNFANATVYDFTLDSIMSQTEVGSIASTPALPAVGALGATTRAAETIDAALNMWAVPAAAQGVMLVAFRTPATAPISRDLFELTGGTVDDRVRVRAGSDGLLTVDVVVGGVTQATVTALGVLAASTDYVAALSFVAGRLALSLSGAAVVVGTPAACPTVTTLRGMAGGQRVSRMAFSPVVPSDASLQTIARQGPIA